MKLNNFRGYLTDISPKKEALIVAQSLLDRHEGGMLNRHIG